MLAGVLSTSSQLVFFVKKHWIIASAAVLLMLCYSSILQGMADQWRIDADMGHGFIVPIIALGIVWKERARWSSTPVRPSFWGFAILIAGACLHLLSVLGAGLFAGSLAFLISVAGLIVWFGGFGRLRDWSFPLLLMLFMLPKLAVVYNQVTLPMQLLASRLAAALLSVTGAAVIREGNILDVAGRRLSVVEACSGIRYLLSLGFVAVVIAYISHRKPWMRFVLLAAAVPLAIAANAIRVAATALFRQLESSDALHAAAGFLFFGICIAALSGISAVLGRIVEGRHA